MARSQYRLRRGPVLLVLLLIGLPGAYLIAHYSLRPALTAAAPLQVPAAYIGTTYAFDSYVCVDAGSVSATVTGARAADVPGLRAQVLARPAGAPPAIAYPVPADAGVPLVGTTVPAGGEQCARLLLTPARPGTVSPGTVDVRVSYGPFGLLRSSLTVTAPITLDVTGSGTDPRTTGS